jgi:hypothetical protein
MKFFERIEDALQKRNRYYWAEKLLKFESHFVSWRGRIIQSNWTRKQNDESLKRRELLQREIYLKEELTALEKLQAIQPLTDDERESIKRWKNELKTINEQYWIHKRAFNQGLLNKPKGSWIRYWELTSKNYSSASERRKLLFKANDGCCEYDCGCCYRPQRSGRMKGHIHCTIECGCCIRRRGFHKPSSR